ncbi:hypothetical protein [Streptomyces hirsutus]|uniref:hypothetical protein n=1 Tax=Streptomyces hirsutus TaxID=35620 RepID=UPI003317AFE7
MLTHAEAELATPHGMEAVMSAMERVVTAAYMAARRRGPSEQALRALEDLHRAGELEAVHAQAALVRQRSGDPSLWDPRRAGDPPPEYTELIDALYAVPQLDCGQVRLILESAAVPHEHERSRIENVWSAQAERRSRRHSYDQAREELVAVARMVLETHDP